jgi:IclR family acetate operon transcriptional repressor
MDLPDKRRRGRPRNAIAPGDTTSVQSLDRALALLALVAEQDGVSLTEAAEAAKLAPSTTYRLLSTLAGRGVVEQDAATQLWHVGVETFRIGSAFLRRRKIAERGREAMASLVDACGETANLAVADEAGVVFVSQVETHAPIRAFFRPGTRSPFHASGIGKAILAHLSPERVAAIVKRDGLPGFTPRTITAPASLAAELARIRNRGIAVDDEERNEGMRCIGAAIFNEFAEPIAGISISGPAARVTRASVAAFGPLVREAAETITRAIAGVTPRSVALAAGGQQG